LGHSVARKAAHLPGPGARGATCLHELTVQVEQLEVATGNWVGSARPVGCDVGVGCPDCLGHILQTVGDAGKMNSVLATVAGGRVLGHEAEAGRGLQDFAVPSGKVGQRDEKVVGRLGSVTTSCGLPPPEWATLV